MKFPTPFYVGLAQLRRRVRRMLATLAGHGLFDFKHFRRLTDPNLPIWLAVLWIGFDLLATAFAWRGTPAKAKAFGFPLLEAQRP
jgi:hypothetical protein